MGYIMQFAIYPNNWHKVYSIAYVLLGVYL